MAGNPPVQPPQPSHEPMIVGQPPQTDPAHFDSSLKGRLMPRKFFQAFTSQQSIDKEAHALYKRYQPYAESIKITLQMLIGTILIFLLIVKFFISIFSPGSPLANLNPLEIIAYGLFFSTGIDLAYMLFTPGPDEAIEPLMTGLAAAILLGIGMIDYNKVQLQHGIILFLAVAALGGLFAIKKFLFHSSEKNEKEEKLD